jgi:hypothetical protein
LSKTIPGNQVVNELAACAAKIPALRLRAKWRSAVNANLPGISGSLHEVAGWRAR